MTPTLWILYTCVIGVEILCIHIGWNSDRRNSNFTHTHTHRRDEFGRINTGSNVCVSLESVDRGNIIQYWYYEIQLGFCRDKRRLHAFAIRVSRQADSDIFKTLYGSLVFTLFVFWFTPPTAAFCFACSGVSYHFYLLRINSREKIGLRIFSGHIQIDCAPANNLVDLAVWCNSKL